MVARLHLYDVVKLEEGFAVLDAIGGLADARIRAAGDALALPSRGRFAPRPLALALR